MKTQQLSARRCLSVLALEAKTLLTVKCLVEVCKVSLKAANIPDIALQEEIQAGPLIGKKVRMVGEIMIEMLQDMHRAKTAPLREARMFTSQEIYKTK